MANLASLTALTLLALALVCSADKCIQVIHVKTGDIASAGTDARVTLSFKDAEGHDYGHIENLKSRGIVNKTNHNYFERNNLDVFAFEIDCFTSPICYIELYHDSTGTGSDWYVSYVQFTSSAAHAPCTQTKFELNRWIKGQPYISEVVEINLCK